MKKIILLSYLLFATLFVNAQRGGGDPEVSAQKRVDRLTTQLDLSVDQQKEIKDLYVEQLENRKAHRKKRHELREEEKKAARAARKEAKAAFDSKLEGILTPDQKANYEKLAEENIGKRKHRGGAKHKGKNRKGKGGKNVEGRGDPANRAQNRVDRLTKQLDLDAQQQKSIYELVFNAAPKTNKQDWKNLSKEEKSALKAERKAKKEAFEGELGKILTPAQLEIYNNLPKKRKGKRGEKGKRIKDNK